MSSNQTLYSLSSKDFYVETIPGLPDTLIKSEVMHAGSIAITHNKSNSPASLFFWLIRARKTHERIKLVLWLNGGPGCSSMDGVFVENGVFRMNKDGNITKNPHSWNENAHMLFLDQPIGTGLSEADGQTIHSSQQAAEHVMLFLDEFLKIFPEYRKAQV